MAPPAHAPSAFSAAVALRRLAAFGLVGTGIAAAHLLFGIGLPCPLFALTGVQCPLCGATRAAGALARVDLAAAWSYNALVVVALFICAGCALVWLVELLGGPALRPPSRVRPLTQDRVYVVVGVIAVGFMLVRNLA